MKAERLLGDIVNTNATYLAREFKLRGIDVYYQSSVGDNEGRVVSEIEKWLKRSDTITTGELEPTNDDITYAQDNIPIETVVSQMLIEKNLTISTAESCTGGLVSATLINYPGISSVFMEGCVTYSNESKINRLGVNPNTLELHGAVSEETAIEMAEGIAKNFNTNVAISTTGIAGPEGGTSEKPVGLVYIGIYINGKTTVNKYILHGNREDIRIKATKNAINDLRLRLLDL